MTIQLSPDLEQALAEEAQRRGTTPELLANEYLRARFVPASQPSTGGNTGGNGAKNLAELLAKHIGVLHSSEHVPGGARMSEETGKKFSEILIKKRQQGRL